MKQLVQYLQEENKRMLLYIGLFVCCTACLLTSCINANEIMLYYKTGNIESPISKSLESFDEEMSSHSVDTVIYIKAKDFRRYCNVINSMQFAKSNTSNIHDYFIGIKYHDIDIALQQPIPDTLNEEITTYTKQDENGKIHDEDLYKLLCSAKYFDFFITDELIDHPLVKKYGLPSGYNYFWSKDVGEIPLKVKSRYKVILKSE